MLGDRLTDEEILIAQDDTGYGHDCRDVVDAQRTKTWEFIIEKVANFGNLLGTVLIRDENGEAVPLGEWLEEKKR